MYKVRFHLGRGENYMKWQISELGGKPAYFKPEDVNLNLIKCTLKNNKKVA